MRKYIPYVLKFRKYAMNIETVINKVLVKYPFFGSVVAHCKFKSEMSLETAGTDGEVVYYNPTFFSSIPIMEQVFILAHEICHIAFNHIWRSVGKDPDLWNMATDAVINAFLKHDGLPLSKGGVDIQGAIDYDAEELYQILLEEKKKQEKNSLSENQKNVDTENKTQQGENQFEQSSSNNENQQKQDGQKEPNQTSEKMTQSDDKKDTNEYHDVGHDTHSMWKKATERKNKEEENPSKEKSVNDSLEEKQESSQETKKEVDKEPENIRHDEIQKIVQLGEKEAFRQNKVERKKQLEELKNALASHSHGHSNDANENIRTITSIGISEPLIDWRILLKEAINYAIDWSYENAGIEDGVVTPYLEELPKPETEIVLDTSGSIDEILLRNFLRECKNILQNSKVKVGCFDTKFYGFTEIKDESDIDDLTFYGGGGTDFNAAVGAFTRRVENKVIFTDGWADMPNTQIDAIWIVFGNCKINPVGGKVIYINESALSRLHQYEVGQRKR